TAPNDKADGLVKLLTTVTQGPNGQSEETAKALWYLGEILYREYKRLPENDVEPKVAALQGLEGVYTQAAQMGSPEWAVASLWKLSLAYQHLSEVVEKTPAPAGMSGAEAQQFKTAVKEQVGQLQERADSAFKTCESRALSLEVFNAAALGCRKRSETAKPTYPQIAGGGGSGGALDELRRKVETSLDAKSLEALGLAYLEARQVGMAQLTLGRAAEIEDNRAAAHNGLGMAALYQGDAMGARASFGKALEADPSYEKARVNMASLRCRFGDAEGAKKDLAGIKESGALSGADVDPDWKACR
ncbi:MAG TPA: hypothetical protein VEY30_02900, partial [Myxococcaceae bacterium]|nr:hypothetical protein [Myxococcaceae bacterium]